MSENNGFFITFEGGDGCGKSTNLELLAQQLRERGREVVIIREPGGTKIGEKIREMLLDKENSEMVSRCELLLYEASRAQICDEVIRPALERGAVVICDRFYDSSVAYQGYGRGLNVADVDKLNMFATDKLVPDITIWLCVDDVDEGLKRAAIAGGEADRLELAGHDFHERVAHGFEVLASHHADRFVKVAMSPTLSETNKRILAVLPEL